MILNAPGILVDVIDESFYASAGNGTVPLYIMATQSNKLTPAGDEIAEGTRPENAGKLMAFTSQRELLQELGNPIFHSLGGSSLHGYELNEYGLLAAHSYLNAAGPIYALRADIDLAELQPLDEAPVGAPTAGTYWLDLANSNFGIAVYNATSNTFTTKSVTYIENVNQIDSNGAPLSTVQGAIGDYVVVAGVVSGAQLGREENRVYRRAAAGWELLDDSVISEKIIFRDHTKPPYADEMVSVALSAAGAGYSVGDRVTMVETAGGSGSLLIVDVEAVDTTGAVTEISVVSYGRNYSGTGVVSEQSVALSSDGSPSAGTGLQITGDTIANNDIWVKTSEANAGTKFTVKFYDGEYEEWVEQEAPLYLTRDKASQAGQTGLIVKYDHNNEQPGVGNRVAEFTILRHSGSQDGVYATGTSAATIGPGSTLSINGVDVAFTGTTVGHAVFDITNAAIDGIFAKEENGALVIFNNTGLDIKLVDVVGAPIADLGLDNGQFTITNGVVHSHWDYLSYEATSSSAPFNLPADGTLWYTNEFAVDLLINDGTGAWQNFTGNVFLQPSLPQTGIASGDVWIDTDQVEEYPVIKRYNGVTWDTIDTTDQTTSSGMLFGDVRPSASFGSNLGANNGDQVGSPDLDADRPDALLYPRDMLLWNTRASSHVVKEWQSEYEYEGNEIGGRWVLASGKDVQGVALFGRHAVKQMIIEAMASVIINSEEVRAESVRFNLIAAPGFPELSDELITLNESKKLTAFIMQEAPMRLKPNSTDLEAWVTNRNGAVSTGDDGLVTQSAYLGTFYPGAMYTTNVDGEEVVVPSSHAVMRTYANNDQVAYPWFAAAFSRRGVVTNATSVGYLTEEDEFQRVELNEGQMEILYQNKVNPILILDTGSIELYGQKTGLNADSSRDRINVVRLENYIRERCPRIARPFLGEPNDRLTRDQVVNVFENFFEQLITQRAIEDYAVVCDESNNTAARRDRNELWIDVVVIPIKTVEFIYIPVRFRNSGASLTIES